MIAKSCLPLSIVDNPIFRRYMQFRNPRIKMPNLRTLTDTIVPRFMAESFDKYVKPKLEGIDSVPLSFDLWMSRGCEEIFDLIVHGIDKNFRRQQIHLRMVECSSTKGADLAEILKPELEKHNLRHQITACVKDGGSNLKTCTEIVREITDCRAMGLNMCSDGICFAHNHSGACNTALRGTVDSQFDQISSSKDISELQACIRWTKKSGKGKEAWFASCIARGKSQRKMPTLVKTRFASFFVMMSMMFLYRDVVEHCFSNQDSIALRQRVPSNSTWEIVGTIVSVMEPLMKAFFVSQEREWLLSDAVARVVKLYLRYEEIASQEIEISTSAGGFTAEIAFYRKLLAEVLMESMKSVVDPLLSFRNLNGKFVHHYLSVFLDPKYKSLKPLMLPLHDGNTAVVKQLCRSMTRRWLFLHG